jgi:hypothetical protein
MITYMKKAVLALAAIGFLAAGPIAFAQTAPLSSGVAVSVAASQLEILTTQLQSLANTPIVTDVDKSQALLILQSMGRVLAAISAELG